MRYVEPLSDARTKLEAFFNILLEACTEKDNPTVAPGPSLVPSTPDRPGDMMGEMAFIDKGLRSATALAQTDCRLVPVDEKRFTCLVQRRPYVSLDVMRVMANRLRRWPRGR